MFENFKLKNAINNETNPNTSITNWNWKKWIMEKTRCSC